MKQAQKVKVWCEVKLCGVLPESDVADNILTVTSSSDLRDGRKGSIGSGVVIVSDVLRRCCGGIGCKNIVLEHIR